MEAGAFFDSPMRYDPEGPTVCDFTGLGVEDLFIARYTYEKLAGESGTGS